LDADGTCDPGFFKELLQALVRQKRDIMMGSRLHPESRMPPVRYAGNWAFRTLVNAFGGPPVNDVASGMRVLRRSALTRLYPLPDGLGFHSGDDRARRPRSGNVPSAKYPCLMRKDSGDPS